MKKIITLLLVLFIINNIFSQDFSRVIELQSNRMTGPDIVQLQTQLKYLGFTEIGEIDGYYGPLTKNAIDKIQYFLGFDLDSKVDKKLWDFLFDQMNFEILKSVSIVSKYDMNKLRKEKDNRMGYSTEGGYVEKYYDDNKIVIIKLRLFGEMGQVEYYLYFLNIDYFFIIEKDSNYPSNLSDMIKDEKAFLANTVIKYQNYLKSNNEIFQIMNGNFVSSDYYLKDLMDIIENKR